MAVESTEQMDTIISHIRNNGTDWEKQSNEEHQRGVAELAFKFASEFGFGEWGRVLA